MRKGLLLLLAMATPLILVAVILVVGIAGSMAPAQASPGQCTIDGFAADKVPNGWGSDVEKAAKESKVPPAVLAAQLEAESGWNPQAMSPVGAQGLAQFMPATWATYGNGGNVFDPRQAIAAQGRFMAELLSMLAPIAKTAGKSPVELALAGYNAGPGAVQASKGIPPYPETQDYVQKILRNAAEHYAGECKPSAPVPGPGGVDTSGKGNNYPWPEGPVGVDNPITHFNYRECVDFAWFRFMEQVGTPNPPFKYDSLQVQPGSAGTWKAAWDRQRWASGPTPKVGAIIWYAPGAPGGSPVYGHVAVVKAVNPDGTVLEEGYNMLPDADHAYYTRTIQAGFPSAYLYIPGKG